MAARTGAVRVAGVAGAAGVSAKAGSIAKLFFYSNFGASGSFLASVLPDSEFSAASS